MVRKKPLHPTKKTPPTPIQTHPPISCGKRQRDIMGVIKNSKERFNVIEYSRSKNLNRQTTYEALRRLIEKKLVKKEGTGIYKITNLGVTILNENPQYSCVGVSSVGGVGVENNLSTHYLKYSVRISDKKDFRITSLRNLNPIKIKTLKLRNLDQVYVYFEDATIVINPKTVIIHVHDIITKDVEESDIRGFNTALDYAEKLESIGLIGEGITLENTHWARVNSVFADLLSKVDQRYFIKLKNGRKFWIDHSTDLIEDETNDKDFRKRLDGFLDDLNISESKMSDVDKIITALSYIARIEVVRMKRRLVESEKINQEVPTERPNYFG